MLVDLAEEQEYFDDALEQRDRLRETLANAPENAANPKDAVGWRKGIDGLLEVPPDDQAAIGSFDEDGGERFARRVTDPDGST